MERHEPSGQFYNWYDHTTGAKLTAWPPTGRSDRRPDPVVRRQRLAGRPASRSSPTAVPEVADRGGRPLRQHGLRLLLPARASTASPSTTRPTPAPRRAATTRSSARAGSPATSGSPRASCRPRSTSARGGRSPTPATGAGRRRSRSASRATYLGVNVFEGAYPYEDFRVVPGWGGSMFEALMPALFVPEEQWAPAAAGRSTTR